jgi:hypothetical protein
VRSLSLRKRLCALLVVLGALGTMVGSAGPVDAQAGPQGVRFGERFRVVSWETPIGNCYDTRYDRETYADVPYGQYREPYLGEWTCGNSSKTFVGDWYTHAEVGFTGWAWAEYQLRVYVRTASGARTNCGTVTAWSWLNDYYTESTPFVWSQAAATSGNGSPGDGFVRLNCGRHGSIRVYTRTSEGRGTF